MRLNEFKIDDALENGNRGNTRAEAVEIGSWGAEPGFFETDDGSKVVYATSENLGTDLGEPDKQHELPFDKAVRSQLQSEAIGYGGVARRNLDDLDESIYEEALSEAGIAPPSENSQEVVESLLSVPEDQNYAVGQKSAGGGIAPAVESGIVKEHSVTYHGGSCNFYTASQPDRIRAAREIIEDAINQKT